MLGNVATGFPSPGLRRAFFPTLVFLLLFLPTLAHAQVEVKVNKDVSLRFGAQIQAWADESQDAATKQYNQNLYIRRARFLVTGSVAPGVTFFIQTDNPNLGKTPKALTTGFVLQDAWAEWKLRDEFSLIGGLMLIPHNREELTSTSSFMTIDVSPLATIFSGPTQTSATRDTGFQAKGYVADGRLEYRAGFYQGIRDPATATSVASRNAFRRALWLQYDFFEKERGYTYAGTNRGTRKILALSSGYDAQKDYKSYSVNLHTTIPDPAKNEVAVLLEGIRYDGGKFIAAIPKQNDYLAEFAYYVAAAKAQPFVKFEDQHFTVRSTPSKDLKRYSAGLNYYVSGQNLKFTGQLTHVKPSNNAIHSTNQFTVQMQVWYY
jgi:hypothetical protein